VTASAAAVAETENKNLSFRARMQYSLIDDLTFKLKKKFFPSGIKKDEVEKSRKMVLGVIPVNAGIL
jgi:hypothetical protein